MSASEEKSKLLGNNTNGTYNSIVSGDESLTDEYHRENTTASYQQQRKFRKRSRSFSSHCHYKVGDTSVDKHAIKRLIFVSILCVIFMCAEIVGGYLSNSLAIATDAAHLLTDLVGFMISLFAIWMASRPATKKMSFGWYRAEVVGALASVLLIWIITAILVYWAILRIISQEFELEAGIMLITASLGVVVNIIMGIGLQIGGVPHGHSHGGATHNHTNPDVENHSHSGSDHHAHNKVSDNINVRAAFIHVLGDFFQSLGVMIAALVIYFKPEWAFIDPICTFLFSILVLITTYNIIKDALNVLMEGIPKGIDFLEVQRVLYKTPGVVKVHNLRIWSLNIDKIAVAAHLAIAKSANATSVLKAASKEVKSKFSVFELTIQVEEYRDEMVDCVRCQDPVS